MQNRFRFRAWDKEEKKMFYNAEMTYDYSLVADACEADSFGTVLEDDNMIVMQCTGLKDKNGKLIYEGDVLDVMGFVLHKVVWNQEYCRFELKTLSGETKLDDWLEDTTGENRNHRIEIKGNIYENPELREDNNGFNTRKNN